ncbi:MAG: hypothetical protein M1834_003222 [Cirrosporium novae-zelandiae]|nr:MAG: hypothetical protein M1834_003222 [Cirrosporium novae-zelandiae]
MTSLFSLTWRSKSLRLWLAAFLLVNLVLILNVSRGWSPGTVEGSLDAEDVVCSEFPGADDIMVIMKTGATEAYRKVPTHFLTTFRCTPHVAIYSDLEQDLGPYHIYDALAQVDDEIKRTNPDFEHYHKLQQFKGPDSQWIKEEIWDYQEAWNLDKWKFLPILNEAWKTMPDAKWFVFIEADTYLVWSNLLQWLQQFDPTVPYYIGCLNYITDQPFAHGGSGYVLSNAALRIVTEHMVGRTQRYNEMTAREWAGDFVMAKVLEEVNITLLSSWPSFQGETPSSLDYTRRQYCHPVMTYHHMSSEDLTSMWHFEQDWIKRNSSPSLMRHGDVFNHLIEPSLSSKILDWDNLSHDWQPTLSPKHTLEACRAACQDQPNCIQYLFSPKRCRLGKDIRLGKPQEEYKRGYVAGWMMERVEEFKKRMEPCTR